MPVLSKGYDKISNRSYKRLLTEVTPDGTIIYKELDAGANINRNKVMRL